MKKYKWYRFTFANGHIVIARGLSKTEQRAIELHNGRLVDKTLEGIY